MRDYLLLEVITNKTTYEFQKELETEYNNSLIKFINLHSGIKPDTIQDSDFLYISFTQKADKDKYVIVKNRYGATSDKEGKLFYNKEELIQEKRFFLEN